MEFKFRPIEQWPRKLTTNRKSSPFRANYRNTMDLLESELDHLGARNVALQVALRPDDIRLDGLPRANARPASHPGVILSFEKWIPNGKRNENGQPLGNYQPFSMPCDAFTDWESNLRAIALALEALRKVDRYGVTQSGEQYRGWSALPPSSSGAAMTVDEAAAFVAMSAGTAATPRDVIDSAENFTMVHRIAMRKVHPDVGGDTAQFQKLQDAIVVLKKYHGIG